MGKINNLEDELLSIRNEIYEFVDKNPYAEDVYDSDDVENIIYYLEELILEFKAKTFKTKNRRFPYIKQILYSSEKRLLDSELEKRLLNAESQYITDSMTLIPFAYYILTIKRIINPYLSFFSSIGMFLFFGSFYLGLSIPYRPSKEVSTLLWYVIPFFVAQNTIYVTYCKKNSSMSFDSMKSKTKWRKCITLRLILFRASGVVIFPVLISYMTYTCLASITYFFATNKISEVVYVNQVDCSIQHYKYSISRSEFEFTDVKNNKFYANFSHNMCENNLNIYKLEGTWVQLIGRSWKLGVTYDEILSDAQIDGHFLMQE